MIPFMFPVACIIPFFYYPNISCEMSPQLCGLHQHLPEGTSVFHKWQRRRLFGPALRRRRSGREMKPGHVRRWKHVFQCCYPHRPSEETCEPSHRGWIQAWTVLSTALFLCTAELLHPCHPRKVTATQNLQQWRHFHVTLSEHLRKPWRQTSRPRMCPRIRHSHVLVPTNGSTRPNVCFSSSPDSCGKSFPRQHWDFTHVVICVLVPWNSNQIWGQVKYGAHDTTPPRFSSYSVMQTTWESSPKMGKGLGLIFINT